jgi:dipeptidyl aminopeptidase/acylaminoacyl peptidase
MGVGVSVGLIPRAAVLLAAALVAAACSGTNTPATDTSGTSTTSAARSADADAVTLRSLATTSAESPTLTIGDQLGAEPTYTTRAAAYPSGGLVVSAVLHLPKGGGTFPAVVLVHGGVSASDYKTGGELNREQAALAQAGYVVLVTDLRGFAASDPNPSPGDVDMGATWDIVNAARALARTRSLHVDPQRIGLVGHSLGGLQVINAMVAAPDVARAVVAIAPASTTVWQNVERFLKPGENGYAAVVGPHGTQQENPQFWADVSPATFASRAAAPLLIVQGTADEVVDPSWTPATEAAWKAAGRRVAVARVDGADHFLDPQWQKGFDAVVAFLDEELA